MKTKVVNFVAAPSYGKSLMSALTFAELKMLHKTAELIQEHAKNLIWQGKFEELDCQWAVSREQYKMIKSVDNKVEYAVTDSPLLLGLFYNRHHITNVCDVTKTEEMILNKMEEFNNIYIFLEKNEDFPFEKEGRIHNEEQSKEIDLELKMLMKELGINKYLLVKSCKSNIPKIIDYIINY